MMEYITLKNSDLTVSRLCMGGCPMGGYGWGAVSEQELVDAIHTALESGINFYDTADTYGLGRSEELLGKTLKSKRHEVVIATKFGVRVSNGKTFYDNSPEWIEQAVRDSLKRLGTDYIDLYQVHYLDQITPLATVVEKLESLKRAGVIRYYGLSNVYLDDAEKIRAFKGRFVSFQNEYSLACRKSEKDIQTLADEMQMTPLTWGSLGQGILTGKYDRSSVFEKNDRRSRDIYINFHGEKLEKNLQIVEKIREISLESGRALPAIAIRFILDHLKDSVVLAGAKRPSQVMPNTEAFGWMLTKKDLNDLAVVSAD